MKSEQVLLITLAAALTFGGCVTAKRDEVLTTRYEPYASRRLWAMAPLRNESGSLAANGLTLADDLAGEFESAPNIDMLPVNRTLAAMDSLKMHGPPANPAEAQQLLKTLGVDGLVVGTITAYDPYDPPKMGLALELYVATATAQQETQDIRALVSASMAAPVMGIPGNPANPGNPGIPLDVLRPATITSAYFDAADPDVRDLLAQYAENRGQMSERRTSVRLHRINMDLFSRFVSHVMSQRLLRAETQRVHPPATVPAR